MNVSTSLARGEIRRRATPTGRVERTTSSAEVAADRELTARMRENPQRTAEHFGGAVTGEDVLGWLLSIVSLGCDPST